MQLAGTREQTAEQVTLAHPARAILVGDQLSR